MSINFLRVALCQPDLALACPDKNALELLSVSNKLSKSKCDIIVFPELSLVGYSCEDLFHNSDLIDASAEQIIKICKESIGIDSVIVFGAPLETNTGFYNCAIIVQSGKILCAVPKSYLPNYSEYYEKRYFDSGYNISHSGELGRLGSYEFLLVRSPLISLVSKCGRSVNFTVEICEDLWSPLPPSLIAISEGASLVVNLSASNGLITKDATRRSILSTYSLINSIAYAYCSSSTGEAVNDVIWDGHCIVASHGSIVYDSVDSLNDGKAAHITDIDIGVLLSQRRKNKTSSDAYALIRKKYTETRIPRIEAVLNQRSFLDKVDDIILPKDATLRYPYLNSNSLTISSTSISFIYRSQVEAIYTRMRSSRIFRVCLGVSGGLDSTHALLVVDQLIKRYSLPADTLIPVVLPSSVSSESSQNDAVSLISSLGYKPRVIEINSSVELMLRNLGREDPHGLQDVTYENVQAGERTSLLFRIANLEGAFVLGTSDLSELALGWCTYGVGDHMSHYGINVGLPKTVIKAIIRDYATHFEVNKTVANILNSIFSRPISPELKSRMQSASIQCSEDDLGPYDVIDYILYHFLKSQPNIKLLEKMTLIAFSESEDIGVSVPQVRKAFGSFCKRFFTSQFKRTAIPNGPKLFQYGSLSPRGDWRSPVDIADMSLWLPTQEDKI